MATNNYAIQTAQPTTFTYDEGYSGGLLIGSTATGAVPLPTTVNNINVSAVLELQSTEGALLIPRMTSTQRDALTAIANGMMIYNTTLTAFQFYQASAWLSLSTGGGDVVGPVSSTDNAIVRWDGTSGALIQNSSVLITDGGLVQGVAATAAGPTYAFTGDTGSGMYSVSVGTLGLSAGGRVIASFSQANSIPVNSFTFGANSTGNGPVIGVTGTDSTINITLTAKSASGQVRITNPGTITAPSFTNSGGITGLSWPNTGQLTLVCSSTAVLDLKQGAGVTNPNYLQVWNTNGVTPYITVSGAGVGGSGLDVGISGNGNDSGLALLADATLTSPGSAKFYNNVNTFYSRLVGSNTQIANNDITLPNQVGTVLVTGENSSSLDHIATFADLTGHVLKDSGLGTGALVYGTNGGGYSVVAIRTSPYAGGGTSNAYTVNGVDSSYTAVATIVTSTNLVSIVKAVCGTNIVTVTFSADPGANTRVGIWAWF